MRELSFSAHTQTCWLTRTVCRVDVKIISYNSRSKGYGFVTMGSESEADKAVAALKGHEFDGRAMNVEKATPQVPRTEASEPRRGRGGLRRGSRGSVRPRAPRPEGPISKTTIYVGNLPYKVVDDDLYNIFNGFNVVKAHVVRRPNGTSKGYGFVTVASEADQTRVLDELKNVECDDRPLHIKAAHSEESYDERESKKGNGEANE